MIIHDRTRLIGRLSTRPTSPFTMSNNTTTATNSGNNYSNSTIKQGNVTTQTANNTSGDVNMST